MLVADNPPNVEPALHHPYLGLLGKYDVGGEDLDLIALGSLTHDLGHTHGLGVVGGHVAGETGLRRAVAWGVCDEQRH